MGRAPFQADGLIRCAEPVDDTDRRHWSAAFGSDYGSHQGADSVAPVTQGVAEIGMHGNNPSSIRFFAAWSRSSITMPISF